MTERACPFCGHKHDFHDNIFDSETTPQKGDYSICIECGEVLIFDDNKGHTRKPTEPELKEALQNNQVKKTITAIKILRSKLN